MQFRFGKAMLMTTPYDTLIDRETFMCSSMPEGLFVLCRREDIDSLMSGFDTEHLHFAGTDMATVYMRDIIDAMDEEMFDAYLRYHFFICERGDMVGISNHFLDIFRK